MIIHFNLWTLDDGGNFHLYFPFGERIRLYWSICNITWKTHYVGWILCKLSNPGACEFSSSRCLAMKCLLFLLFTAAAGLDEIQKGCSAWTGMMFLSFAILHMKTEIWHDVYDKNRLLDCDKNHLNWFASWMKDKKKILSIWLQRLSLQRPL